MGSVTSPLPFPVQRFLKDTTTASGRGAAWGWGRLKVSSRESLAPASIVADFKELFPQAGNPVVVHGDSPLSECLITVPA